MGGKPADVVPSVIISADAGDAGTELSPELIEKYTGIDATTASSKANQWLKAQSACYKDGSGQ